MKTGNFISVRKTKLGVGFFCIPALALASCLAIPGYAAAASSQTTEHTNQPGNQSADQSGNQQRHQQLLADTAKLLQLAGELKAEVDKSTKDQLSVSVVKKADEVGKLARKVREEMKTAN